MPGPRLLRIGGASNSLKGAPMKRDDENLDRTVFHFDNIMRLYRRVHGVDDPQEKNPPTMLALVMRPDERHQN